MTVDISYLSLLAVYALFSKRISFLAYPTINQGCGITIIIPDKSDFVKKDYLSSFMVKCLKLISKRWNNNLKAGKMSI
jgi:hypothetical protein